MKKNIKIHKVLIINCLILILTPLLLSIWVIFSDDWLNFSNFFTIFRKSCLGVFGHLLFHASGNNGNLFIDIIVILFSFTVKIGLLNLLMSFVGNKTQIKVIVTLGVILYSIFSGGLGIIYAVAV